jgi:hypothetical protein
MYLSYMGNAITKEEAHLTNDDIGTEPMSSR